MRRMIPIAILLAALPIPGQVPGRTSGTAPLEVTLAYSAMRFNTIPAGCGCSWMPGGKAEFRVAFSRHIGLVGEIAGQHAGAINSAHQDLSLVSYLFGPRLSWPVHRFTPFVQGLIGGVVREGGQEVICLEWAQGHVAREAYIQTTPGGQGKGV